MLIHPVFCSVSKWSKNEMIQVCQIWTRETSNWLLQPTLFFPSQKSQVGAKLFSLQISANSNSETWTDFSTFLDAFHPPYSPPSLYCSHNCCWTGQCLGCLRNSTHLSISHFNLTFNYCQQLSARQLVSKWSLIYTLQFDCIVGVYDSEYSFIYCAVRCISEFVVLSKTPSASST